MNVVKKKHKHLFAAKKWSNLLKNVISGLYIAKLSNRYHSKVSNNNRTNCIVLKKLFVFPNVD